MIELREMALFWAIEHDYQPVGAMVYFMDQAPYKWTVEDFHVLKKLKALNVKITSISDMNKYMVLL